jgi:hypothetical protein
MFKFKIIYIIFKYQKQNFTVTDYYNFFDMCMYGDGGRRHSTCMRRSWRTGR